MQMPLILTGHVSAMATQFAVAEPDALATEIKYSIIAPGMALGLVVLLTGSLTTRLDLKTVMFAAAT